MLIIWTGYQVMLSSSDGSKYPFGDHYAHKQGRFSNESFGRAIFIFSIVYVGLITFFVFIVNCLCVCFAQEGSYNMKSKCKMFFVFMLCGPTQGLMMG